MALRMFCLAVVMSVTPLQAYQQVKSINYKRIDKFTDNESGWSNALSKDHGMGFVSIYVHIIASNLSYKSYIL